MPNNYGRTPIHLAAENGHVDVMKILLPYANDTLNTPDFFGDTPMDLALQNGHDDVVNALVIRAIVGCDSEVILGFGEILGEINLGLGQISGEINLGLGQISGFDEDDLPPLI